MSRVAPIVVVLCVVIAGLYVVGCNRQTAPPPGPPGGGPMMPPGGPMSGTTYTYVCPDHPDQTADAPGKCPTCDRFMKADTDEPVEYFCPAHAESVQDEPGECPECGLPLMARPQGASPGEPGPAPEEVTRPSPNEPGMAPSEESGQKPPEETGGKDI